jgi:hypothetical protein
MGALDRSQEESALGKRRRAAAATKLFWAKQVCANGHRWSRVLAAHLAVSVSVFPLDCVRARVRAPVDAGSALELLRRACKFCVPALVCVVCEHVRARATAEPGRIPSNCGARAHARCVHGGCLPSAQRVHRNSSVQSSRAERGPLTHCYAPDMQRNAPERLLLHPLFFQPPPLGRAPRRQVYHQGGHGGNARTPRLLTRGRPVTRVL